MQVNREWISISDMMAGLMMVFLFISVVFMLQTQNEKEAMAEIALTVKQSKEMLNAELHKEFDKDMEEWGAIILDDNTIRFKEPDILFAKSKSSINVKFVEILNDFFPRYVHILTRPEFKDDIEELRIEGHTSSTGRKGHTSSKDDAYLYNARLSQDRSFSVLAHTYMLPELNQQREWLNGVIRANGLSFAKLIKDENGMEDKARSRRVEFRVKTKTEEKIYKIIAQSKQ